MAVVVDVGTLTTRAGVAGASCKVFPTPLVSGTWARMARIVGRARHQQLLLLHGQEVFVGEEAVRRRGILRLSCPLERGVVVRWDDMERIWSHIFFNEPPGVVHQASHSACWQRLKVDIQEHPVLLVEPPLTPKEDREALARMIFEARNSERLVSHFQSCSNWEASPFS